MRAGAIALAGVIGGLRQRDRRQDHARRARERQFPGSRRVRKTSSAIKLRTDASMRFEKSQDPANTVRGLARAIELLQELSPGIRLVGGVADQKTRDRRRRRPSTCRSTGWSASWAAPSRPPKCATFWSAWNSASPKPAPRRLLASPCRPGAPPKTSPSRTTWWKKSAAWWATIPSRRRRRWCPRPCRPAIPSASSSTRCATCSSTRASPKSTTTRSSARKRCARSASIPPRTCASPIPSRPTRR